MLEAIEIQDLEVGLKVDIEQLGDKECHNQPQSKLMGRTLPSSSFVC